MTLDQVKKVRNELHHLVNDDREMFLPLEVAGGDGNYRFDEMTSCFLWDDSNEILYIVTHNTVPTSTLDSRLLPMEIFSMEYASIEFIMVRVDRTCLDNFFEAKVSDGLTNETTRKRYFNQMTQLFEDEFYLMGQPSTTTEKRGIKADDEIIDRSATQTL